MPTSDQPVLDGWLTPREAAERIGVSPHQVRHLARMGKLRALRFGRAWLIEQAAVEAYASADRHPGPQPAAPPAP